MGLRCDLCGWMGPRKDREVNAYGPLWICRLCFLSDRMLEKYEFSTPYRGPMVRLIWHGFDVTCVEWPETFLAMERLGFLGPKAAAEAKELREALESEW